MNAPQVCMVVWISISLVVNLMNHGQPRKVSFGGALLDSLLVTGLLIWGGFFN